MIAEKLDVAIRAVCPIHGVSIGKANDKATWRVDFSDATDAQKAAAKAIIEAFDAVAETRAEVTKRLTDVIQAHLDAQAQAKGYDDLRSAISYRGSANPTWASEADAFFAWRDAVWERAVQVISDVQVGKAAMPAVDEALAMMPELKLP